MNRIEKKRPARPSRKTPTLAAAPGTVTTAVQQYRPADQRQIQATSPNNNTAGPPEKNEATCACARVAGKSGLLIPIFFLPAERNGAGEATQEASQRQTTTNASVTAPRQDLT